MNARRISSLISAGALSLLTLGTFSAMGALVNNGPEGTIKRLHRLILQGDGPGVARLFYLPNDPNNRMIVDEAVRSIQFGRFNIVGIDYALDKRPLARVRGTYGERGRQIQMFWILRKDASGWRIDTNQTILELRGISSGQSSVQL